MQDSGAAAQLHRRDSAIAFTAFFWFWHAPRAYDETLQNNFVYWTMHLTLFGAAFAFWGGILRSSGLVAFCSCRRSGCRCRFWGAHHFRARAALFGARVHHHAMGSELRFQDQQLGGLLMWAPAGLRLVLYSALALGSFLNTSKGRPAPLARIARVEHY